MSKRKNIIDFSKRNQNDAFPLSDLEQTFDKYENAIQKHIAKDLKKMNRLNNWLMVYLIALAGSAVVIIVKMVVS